MDGIGLVAHPYGSLQVANGSASTKAAMRLRVASSGILPRPPPILSSMFFAWLVAGVAAKIEGCDTTNLRKN